jgi:hypothetical protein
MKHINAHSLIVAVSLATLGTMGTTSLSGAQQAGGSEDKAAHSQSHC